MNPAAFAAALLSALAWAPLATPNAASADELADPIVVTASRYPVNPLDLIGNTAKLGSARIELLNATHIYEVGTQLPGVWFMRGSGQENLTAIRSPVLTGPGSCGSFLVLEDGMPIRPTGFCNVNDFFEIPSEQAASIEVIRGPANALYGSNAMHGTVNVLLPEPGPREFRASLEAGPNQFVRGKVLTSTPLDNGAGLVGGLLFDHDGGFRVDSGYHQTKGFLKYSEDTSRGQLDLGLSGNILDQDTAGFIVGEDAYKDEAIRDSNPNAGSYRDASSLRLTARWRPVTNTTDQGWDLRSYLLYSRKLKNKFRWFIHLLRASMIGCQ